MISIFDGEPDIANRNIVDEIAFLYDLLGAFQEHKIKPKTLGHSDFGFRPSPTLHAKGTSTSTT